MQIELTSTLTGEDENRVAPAILKAVATFLELVPVAYHIRINTIDAKTYELIGPARESADQNTLRLVRDAGKSGR